jgi:hypothetical protein
MFAVARRDTFPSDAAGKRWELRLAQRRECGEPGSTSKQSGKRVPNDFRSSPVAGTLNTDERALGHTSFGRSLARGDRLHLVASAAHGGPATVDGGSRAHTPLVLEP